MIDRLNTALEGRYRIERELGEGGMATVYLAEDVKHGRRVALKVLKPELAAVVGAERFLKEIEVTAGLQHPHILPLFDSGEADGFLFYVMPYVEGESLRERLDRDKQLPVDEAVALAAKVAGALQEAHDQGVIHRDIKPANILLAKGEPLVADFGIALAVQEAGGGRLTETGLSLGTPYYMSPEQATGDRDVTATSDVYALGCVLYEMLVGEPPYVGNTAQAVLGKILTDTPRSPTTARASVPPNVEGAVLKALEKLPADRFRSADEFVRALTDPGFRYGERAMPGASATSQPWRVLAIGASAVAVLLAVLLAWTSGRTSDPDPLRFQMVVPEDLAFLSGPGVVLDVAPDGSELVFVGSSAGRSQLWVRSMNRLEPRPVPGTAGGRNPRFSPDGGSVAFTADDALMTVSLAGGPPLTLIADSVPDGGGGLTWGSDGYLYVTRFDGRVWRVSEGGGGAELVAGGDGEERMHWPDALPDGKGILFTRDLGTPADDRIEVLSLETGEARPLFQGAMARYVPTGHVVYTDGGGTLLAVPFDPDRLEVTGATRTILEDVTVNSGSASQFAISKAGVLAFFSGMASRGITPTWLGGEAPEEAIPGLPSGFFWFPAVSPDGRRVAFTHTSALGGRADIWIHDRDDGVFTRFTFEGENFGPFWSPDGREVGFLSDRREEDGQRFAVYARPSDLSGEPRLLRTPSGRDIRQAFWTPDGRRLVYVTEGGGIHHAPPHPDSSEVVFLSGSAGSAALSPDGRWIAFTSEQSGAPQIYVRPFPGPGGQYQVSAQPARGQRWTVDGERLVYQREDDDMWIGARVRTTSGFQVVERAPFADGDDMYLTGEGTWDLAPDGRLIAARAGARSGEGRLVVVTNWFHELRARMGEGR